MKITLLLTGKTKEAYLQEGLDEYIKRLKYYVPLQVVVIPDIKAGKAGVEQVKKLEGEHILQKIKNQDYVILMDERGQHFSSEAFAKHLTKLEGRTGSVVFVIGGAYGFSDAVYKKANEMISLSKMTFSHQMIRLIFSEQLYRAYTILRGEPYHHK